MSRHNISIPDDELWARVQKAAAEEGARQGRTVSVSEWIRSLVIKELGEK